MATCSALPVSPFLPLANSFTFPVPRLDFRERGFSVSGVIDGGSIDFSFFTDVEEAAEEKRAEKAEKAERSAAKASGEYDTSSPAGNSTKHSADFSPFAITHAEVVTAPTLGSLLDPREITVFDIETGAVSNIHDLIGPDEPLPEFDESSVKVGNLKDESKKRDKIEYARANHAADWSEKCRKNREKQIEKAALSPMTGEIVAIGYGDGSGRRVIHGASECDMLHEFWAHYRRAIVPTNSGKLAGWFIGGFDLPFIVQRSWLREVPVPNGVISSGRYWSATFIDMMDVFRLGVRDNFGLDEVARYFGFAGKNGEGKEFADKWRSGNEELRREAVAYLTNDISMAVAVGRRIGVL